MVQQILLVVGALFVVWGSALQAVNEIGQYGKLLDALDRSDLTAAVKEGLALGLTLTIWPASVPHMVRWIKRYLKALTKFGEMALGEDADATVIGIRTGLLKARNWTIVLLGSTLVLAAAVVELATS